MEVVAVRGSSYVSDNTKINPNQLSEKQKKDYMELVVKTKIMQFYTGDIVMLDEALSGIDYSNFTSNLTDDAKLLLENIIKYRLYIYGIDIKNIDIKSIINRF